MNAPEQTVADLRLEFDGTPFGATLEFAVAQDNDARLAAVQKAVDFACNLLEKHKHEKQGLSEDQISLQICEMLIMAGFPAAHDKDVGGHCDLSIEGKDLFLWLAEAKKHSAYGWLDKGFQQLSTRYSTGVKGQDHGDVLIYCYVTDAAAMLEKWRKELQARNPEVTTQETDCGNQLVFCSTHKHVSSGLDFNVRHKAIALHWDPQDN
ncbi:MAG: hypothetical protein ACE363_14770 [Alphaproteobacteria bacterium]